MSAHTEEIRELSEAEIQKRLRETCDQLLNLNIRKHTGQVEHPHEFSRLKHEVARLKTILREKELAATATS